MKKQTEDKQNNHVDFYFEDDIMVMTSKYHIDRGYCCGSGCRHCPYKTFTGEDLSENGPSKPIKK